MSSKLIAIGVLAAMFVGGSASAVAQNKTVKAAKPSISQNASRAYSRMARTRTKDDAQAPTAPGMFSSGELVARDFTIPSGGCSDFDSNQDLTGADRVTISIFALDANISSTQIVTLFGVPDSPYVAPTSDLIDGSNFLYSDGGSGTVSVAGRDMRIRVCNGSRNSVRYDQLTAYATGAQFAGNHF